MVFLNIYSAAENGGHHFILLHNDMSSVYRFDVESQTKSESDFDQTGHQVVYSCSVIYQNAHWIIGGRDDEYKMSKVDGCNGQLVEQDITLPGSGSKLFKKKLNSNEICYLQTART